MQSQKHNKRRGKHGSDRSAHDPVTYRERIHQHRHQDKLQEVEFCTHFGLTGCEIQVLCGGKERPVEAVEAQNLEGSHGGEPLGALKDFGSNNMIAEFRKSNLR